jgi:hypothetical protein
LISTALSILRLKWGFSKLLNGEGHFLTCLILLLAITALKTKFLLSSKKTLKDRLKLIALKLLVPYLLNFMIKDFKLNRRGFLNFKIYISIVKIALLFAQRINRIVFLFTNTFYHIENALTHIKIANLNPHQHQRQEQESLRTLHLIGIVKCFTILMQLINEAKYLHQNNLKNFISSSLSKENETTSQLEAKTNTLKASIDDNEKSFCCLLCLDHLNEPTSAMCGHIFCFSCIQAYINSNTKANGGGQVMTKCPSCRSNIEQNKLIYLHNF